MISLKPYNWPNWLFLKHPWYNWTIENENKSINCITPESCCITSGRLYDIINFYWFFDVQFSTVIFVLFLWRRTVYEFWHLGDLQFISFLPQCCSNEFGVEKTENFGNYLEFMYITLIKLYRITYQNYQNKSC